MKSIIVWVIIVIGLVSGGYLIFSGLRRTRQDGPEFKIKHFFQNIPIGEHSGTQLIIEGIGVILSSGVLYYAFFLWRK